MSRSASASAAWEKKRNTSKPLTAANLKKIKMQFGIKGELKVITWAKHYAVSDCGRVFSNRPTLDEASEIREMTLTVDKEEGYGSVSIIRDDGQRVDRRVHRLVAEAFIPNHCSYPLVLHRDGNPANNAASNLYWGTYADNIADARRHGTLRIGSRATQAKTNEIQVAILRLTKAAGLPTFAALLEIGLSPSHGAAVANKKNWSGVPSGEVLLAAVKQCISEHAAALAA